jgi:hypothetical protein
MKTLLLAAVTLCVATPIMAQPAPAPAVKEAPADPARLAAAKPVIDKLWPLGTYRRMMDGTMSKMMDAMIDTAMGMKPSDFAKMGGAASEASIGEAVTKADPHFRERMKISMDVMMGEMIPLMEKVEPQVRESLSIIYARKYTASQLNDMVAFFATPTGALYARESMLVFMDPEMLKGMQAFTPELVSAMPAIMKKVEAATAHLPPLPKPKAASDEDIANAASAIESAADAATAESDADPAYDPANWSAEDRATHATLESQYSAAGDKFFGFSEEASARAKAKMNAKK